ncbi:MAG TPA: type II toxin-antitoxin system VapC family toxin [Actinomycetota bacterium]
MLDTTVLIAHLRGDGGVTEALLKLLAAGHSLGTTCVNVAEIERGLRPRERNRVRALLDRLSFFETTREAAIRAGRYQAEWARRGRTIHTPDALIAGTARAHGAVIVTDNLDDFPMRDVRARALGGSWSGPEGLR